jgi:short-subunit dehydrogenase
VASEERAGVARSPDLAGGVAIVTGASAGIGEATARLLAAAGIRVALCARRGDRLERLAETIGRSGGEALARPLDVTDAPALAGFVEAVLQRWGRVDVLVNNAGRGLMARFEDTGPAEFRDLLDLNVIAPMVAAQAVLPAMRRQGRGHIINVGSIVGRRNVPGRAAYGATKFALVGWTEALRTEVAGTGIAVSLVYPVYTATEFHAVEPARWRLPRRGPAQSAGHVARAILGCVRRPRPEVYPYWPSRLLAAVSPVAPRLVDRLLARILLGPAGPRGTEGGT